MEPKAEDREGKDAQGPQLRQEGSEVGYTVPPSLTYGRKNPPDLAAYPVSLLPSCAIWGKSLQLPESQCPHLRWTFYALGGGVG